MVHETQLGRRPSGAVPAEAAAPGQATDQPAAKTAPARAPAREQRGVGHDDPAEHRLAGALRRANERLEVLERKEHERLQAVRESYRARKAKAREDIARSQRGLDAYKQRRFQNESAELGKLLDDLGIPPADLMAALTGRAPLPAGIAERLGMARAEGGREGDGRGDGR